MSSRVFNPQCVNVYVFSYGNFRSLCIASAAVLLKGGVLLKLYPQAMRNALLINNWNIDAPEAHMLFC